MVIRECKGLCRRPKETLGRKSCKVVASETEIIRDTAKVYAEDVEN